MNAITFLNSIIRRSILALLVLAACSVTLPAPLAAQDAELQNGTLFVSGNQYANQIEIYQNGSYVFVEIDGTTYISDGNDVFFAEDIDVIEVSAGSGNDSLLITDLDSSFEIKVITGSGTDTVKILNVDVDSLEVQEGESRYAPPAYSWANVTMKDVRADDCSVQCYDLTIDEGRFNYCFTAAAFQDIRHVDAWNFYPTAGIDSRLSDITLNDIQGNTMYVYSDIWRSQSVEDSISMSNIRMWRLYVVTFRHEDDIRLTGSDIMGNINIDTGQNKDEDFVYLNGVYCQGQINVTTGDADDDVFMIQCETESSTYVQTRGGADFAYSYNSDFGTVYSVQTGSGNDRARFSRSSVPTGVFNGGSGSADRLELYYHNIVNQQRSGFEIISD